MASIYLGIDYATGKLYEYSKAMKPGFEQVVGTKSTTYRRYQDSVVGVLQNVSIYDNPNLMKDKGLVVQELRISFKTGDDYNNISVVLENQDKSYSRFAESIITHLPNLVKGATYEFTPYSFNDDNGNKVVGVSIKNENGEKVVKLKQKFAKKDGTITEGDIPPVLWKEQRGKNVKDDSEKMNYLYEVMQKELPRLEFVRASTPVAESTTPPTPSVNKLEVTNIAPSNVSVDDDDDLPF